MILDGTLRLRLGADAIGAPAGTVAHVRGDEPHTFANPGAQPVRMLVGVTPAGFEQFFRDMAAGAGGGVPDPETVARLNAEHGCARALRATSPPRRSPTAPGP